MRLQKLYIKGFKSFADETVINFDDNVIGVVGPNGSGKSNIVDAIRWVLGEQKNRELRLDKMSDIIFNGTKKRKSSGVAQVSMTFDNTKNILPTEFDTVTVSRLLYRSGDSEYRLNNVACRLKDIQSLFIDTGIGSNSYAIIALGMVDDILSDKENARRKMFEQAAGVSKFKRRKRETLNKLKLTETDLNRVEDILFELSANLKSLERQAKKAARYKEIKTDYKESSLQYSNLKLTAFREDINKMQVRVKEESQKYEEINTKILAEEAAVQKHKAENIDKEKDLSSLQKELNELINNQRNQEHQKNLLAEKLNYNKNRIQEISKEQLAIKDTLKDLRGKSDNDKKQSEKLKQDVEQSEKSVIELDVSNQSLKSEFDQMKSAFDTYTLQKMQASQKLQDREKDKVVFQEQVHALSLELDRTNERIKTVLIAIKSKETEIDALEKQRTTKQNLLAEIESKKAQKGEEIKALEQRISDFLAENAKTKRKLDAASNERDLLKNMMDSLEGYPESIKFLHDQWKGQYPLLGDVITPDDKVKAILEQYLDQYLNYYIVPDFPAAVKAIKLLKNSQKGKANFFILNEVKSLSQRPASKPLLTPIIDFVKTDGKYRDLIYQLLQNAYIFDGELDQLPASLGDGSFDVLSTSGSFLKSKYKLSGGSVGLFEGHRLGRKKQLEELDSIISNLAKELEKQESTIEKEGELLQKLKQEDLDQELKNTSMEISEVNQQLTKVKTELQISSTQNKEWLDAISALRSSVELKKNALVNTDAVIAEIQKEITSNLKDDNITDQSVDQLADRLSKSTDTLNQAKIELLKKQNELESVNQELRYYTQQQEQLIEKQAQNEQLIAEMNEQNKENEAQIEQLSHKLIESYEYKKTFESKLTTAEQNYFKAKGETNAMEDKIKALQRKFNDCQSIINNFKDKQTSINYEMNALYERMNLEFGLEKQQVDDIVAQEEEVSLVELELKVNKLKARVHGFGEVNPLALTAFEEMKERHESILTQRDDIVESKKSLIETIEEIEIKATDQFMLAFNEVKVNFKEVFRSLFSEDDDCDLVLLEGNSPLDANIEIIAKPKGKKPKSLSQLSGGEKTLTATALLFALYLLKPAPFCIFDEVDAPLDDSNIQKFNKIIKKFSDRSQFIIVTHNKLTMAEVDVLYGVYMQEQGVSGLSPVDLRNYKYDSVVEVVG